jgi:sodium/hydrogen antiporter
VFIFDIEFKAAEQIVEVILAILLFTDATEVPGGVLGREPRLTLRLLLFALPLSLLMAWLVGVVLLHGVNLWLLAVLATIVMPLDLAPAAAFVRDHRIPERLRQVLTAESGLTDGIVAPVFLFCLAAATAAGNQAQADAAIDAGPALVVAVLIGALVGAVAARVLHRALQAGWTQPSALRLGVLALPLLAYTGAVVLGGNGFIAAFVAGVFFEPEARRLPADALHLVEDIGALLSLALRFLFGAVLNDVVERGSITWQIVLFAWRCRHRGRYRGVGRGGLRLGRCGSARTGAPSRPPAMLRPTHRRWAPRTSNAPIRSQSSGYRWPNARRARLVEPTRRGWDRPRPPPWHCRRPVPAR